jgi:lincosamide nucleotidyltransferase B/F
MSPSKQDLLLSRLNDIGASLARSNKALALIGLGSVGIEVDRLDEFSDLDFFAIVEPGYKAEFIEDLGWLGSISPIAYSFRNTPDGHKLLFRDGVFCEFAIFEERELPEIPFAPGRIIWKKQGVPDTLALPQRVHRVAENTSLEWSLGEALTNLYVGASRFYRGEKLSAMRLIQGYAVDRVLELAELIQTSAASPGDVFAPERRYEQRRSSIANELSAFMQGYDRSIESAEAILLFLERHFPVNECFKQMLLELFQGRRYEAPTDHDDQL